MDIGEQLAEQPEIEKGRKNTPKERKCFVSMHHHRWALRFMLPHFPESRDGDAKGISQDILIMHRFLETDLACD